MKDFLIGILVVDGLMAAIVLGWTIGKILSGAW